MKVLVTGAFKDFDKLKQEFQDLDFTFVQNEQEKLDIDVSNYEYVICNSLFLYNDINKFKSLKYIQVTSAGLDRLPMDYIEKNNIKVYNARGVYSIPMAEWTICKILDVYKNSFKFYENQKEHKWEKDRNILELNGKTATIVGYGSVGQEIAKRLNAFEVRVITVDKNIIKDDIVSKSYTIKDLHKAIKESNIIILTLPLTKETQGLFNKDVFKNINNNPVLINIARGKIINTNDLISNHDRFLSIILDVFEEEPLEDNDKLWNLDNIIITPHNSFVGEQNNERLYEVIKNNIEGVINE